MRQTNKLKCAGVQNEHTPPMRTIWKSTHKSQLWAEYRCLPTSSSRISLTETLNTFTTRWKRLCWTSSYSLTLFAPFNRSLCVMISFPERQEWKQDTKHSIQSVSVSHVYICIKKNYMTLLIFRIRLYLYMFCFHLFYLKLNKHFPFYLEILVILLCFY